MRGLKLSGDFFVFAAPAFFLHEVFFIRNFFFLVVWLHQIFFAEAINLELLCIVIAISCCLERVNTYEWPCHGKAKAVLYAVHCSWSPPRLLRTEWPPIRATSPPDANLSGSSSCMTAPHCPPRHLWRAIFCSYRSQPVNKSRSIACIPRTISLQWVLFWFQILILQTPANCISQPYWMYKKCFSFSTLICCGW